MGADRSTSKDQTQHVHDGCHGAGFVEPGTCSHCWCDRTFGSLKPATHDWCFVVAAPRTILYKTTAKERDIILL